MLQSKESRNIFLSVFFLSGLGLSQVYSSSYIFALESYGSGLFFFKKQLLFTVLGFGAFFIAALAPWHISRRLGAFLWLASALGLVLTLAPHIGVSAGGASRWLGLPLGFRLQPSEFFKASTPFAIAYLGALHAKWPFEKKLFWIIPCFCFGLPLVALSQQPDFGSIALLLALCFFSLFMLGAGWGALLALMSGIALAGGYLIMSAPYRLSRIKSFLDPWQDPFGEGFQVIQSLLAAHSGGLWGQGLGKGQSKLFFLPEAHTDFTFAALSEETGFLGLALTLSVYGFLTFNGLKIALKTADLYQKTVAFGLISAFFLSFFVHCAVNLSLLPAKGLAMPFLSYGGSALLSVFLIFGWLAAIERDNRLA